MIGTVGGLQAGKGNAGLDPAQVTNGSNLPDTVTSALFVIDSLPAFPASSRQPMEHAAPDSSIEALAALMRGRRALVLSGAGISTESGIPDYRGPQGSLRARKPMTYQEFAQSAENRRRYWARSASGWERVRGARPNAGHLAVARLESLERIAGVITQNVDSV